MQEAIELSGIFIDGGPVAQYKTKEPKVYENPEITIVNDGFFGTKAGYLFKIGDFYE